MKNPVELCTNVIFRIFRQFCSMGPPLSEPMNIQPQLPRIALRAPYPLQILLSLHSAYGIIINNTPSQGNGQAYSRYDHARKLLPY